jgi:heterodisulfide reductase subunit C
MSEKQIKALQMAVDFGLHCTLTAEDCQVLLDVITAGDRDAKLAINTNEKLKIMTKLANERLDEAVRLRDKVNKLEDQVKKFSDASEILELVYNMCPMDRDLEKQVENWLNNFENIKQV